MKYLHIVKLVIGDVDNVAFCGLAWSVKGVAKILSEALPCSPNLEQLSWSPTGLLCRWKDHDHVYIHIENMKRPTFEGDIGWVVTKRNEGRMTERIWAVFDSKEKAIEFIERQVDEPMFMSLVDSTVRVYSPSRRVRVQESASRAARTGSINLFIF